LRKLICLDTRFMAIGIILFHQLVKRSDLA
jgi:hypothetical protein